MDPQEFIVPLAARAREVGVTLSASQCDLCFHHIRLMLEWNTRINLTRITEPDEIIAKHLLDSWIPARWLPNAGPALDVGTGPGFPGIPLKILHPELEMVLLESHRKKVSFLKVVIATLGLPGLSALQERWEAMGASGRRFRLIAMRAVRLEPEDLTVRAPALLLPGGIFAWWAGPSAPSEWPTLSGPMRFSGAFPYTLPGERGTRHLLTWQLEPDA